jgi:hypothetical protein
MFSKDKSQTFSINKMVMTEKWTCIVKELEAAVELEYHQIRFQNVWFNKSSA